MAQGVGRHKGITVAVAANPAANVQQVGQMGAGIGCLKLGGHFAVYAGDGAEKAERKIAYAIADFIGHGDFEVAGFVGLPQRPQHSLYLALQILLAAFASAGGALTQ